jgi:hypothetical protein
MELIIHKATVIGCPTKYREEYCADIVKYFVEARQKVVETVYVQIEESARYPGSKKQEVRTVYSEIPTFQRFALSIGTHPDTLTNWAKKFPEFNDAVLRCKAVQEDFLIHGLLSGRIPTMAGIFVAKNITTMKEDFSLTHSQPIEGGRPVLADRSPEQLNALKESILRAQALGLSLTLDTTKDRGGV